MKAKKKLTVDAQKKRDRKNYLNNRYGTFENRLRNSLYSRRKDSKIKGITFGIRVDDFEPQTDCPLLRSIKFCFTNDNSVKDNSMSVDRIDPNLGYTIDNVWLISHRANRIKNNATFEEFEEIYLNWKAEIERRRNAKRT